MRTHASGIMNNLMNNPSLVIPDCRTFSYSYSYSMLRFSMLLESMGLSRVTWGGSLGFTGFTNHEARGSLGTARGLNVDVHMLRCHGAF